MNFFAFSSLVNGIIAIIFGLFVYSRNRKSLINQTFVLLNFGLAIWSLSYWRWLLADNIEMAFFWSRLLNFGAILIPIFYLHWALVLLNLDKKKRKIIVVGYLITFLFLLFSFSPWYIKSVKPILFFPYWPQAGPLYICYLIFNWLGLVGYGFYQLIRNKKTAFGHKRAQINYVILGSIIGFGGGATNFPLMFGVSLFPPFGNPLIVLYPLILSYAIVKYRLMDIRLVFGRGAVYVFSFFVIIALAFLLMFLNNQLGQPLPLNVSGPLIIIISVLLFQPIFRFFEKLASKYFYYTFYSYQTVLTDLGKRLTQFLDLDTLASLITNTLLNTMKLDKTVILLREPETGNYQIKKNIGFREENGISLVKDNFLTVYLEKTQNPLVYEELSLIIRDTKEEKEKEKLENLRVNMKRIEAALCLPLLIEEKITGLIVLGNKLSGEPYSVQDIELLTNLSNQASIALQNARLYYQVQDLSQNLQKKVDEQTKEIRKAYEVEKRAHQELQRLTRAREQFLLSAQHYFRTPLTTIIGYLDLMAQGLYDKEKLPFILKSAIELRNRIEEGLAIGQFQAGKAVLELKEIQLKDFLKGIIKEFEPQIKEKKLSLKTQFPKEELPKIKINPERMREAYSNLIDNAIKHTKEGGMTINLELKEDSILFSVKDTGIGIPKEELPYIGTSPFERGREAKKLSPMGKGIGLYLSRLIVQAHGGKLWAESEGEGKGSTFFVELPRHQSLKILT